jgi:hypothetical protein
VLQSFLYDIDRATVRRATVFAVAPVYWGRAMPKTAKATDIGGRPKADSDVLHFLTRTLQSHVLDAEPQDVSWRS